MAKGQHNRYQKAALKENFKAHLETRLHTKGLAGNSLKETGKDIVVGVLGGGLVAALLGRYSLLAGLGVTFLGHYTGNPITSSFGLGMMASPNLVGSAVNGLDGMDGIKERVQAFKDNMMQRTFLDKVIKKKETVNGTVGELQYFDYGQMSGVSDNPELYGDLSVPTDHPELMGALNDIEQSIAEAGIARLQGTSVGALQADIDGIGYTDMDGVGYADVSDYNF